jgi:hypothetical protein
MEDKIGEGGWGQEEITLWCRAAWYDDIRVCISPTISISRRTYHLPTGRCEQKQKRWLPAGPFSLIQLRRRLQGSVDLIKCAGGRAVDAISKPDAVVLSEKGRDVIYTYRPDSPMSLQQPIACELSSNRCLQWLVSVSTIEMNQWSCSSKLGSRAWANFHAKFSAADLQPCSDTCRACFHHVSILSN